jgi:hypothetical protein
LKEKPTIGDNEPLQYGPLAQLVEQETLNLWVHGSSPWRVTILGLST